LIKRHRGDDLLAAYADRLEAPAIARQALRGYLTGSLDAVLRVSGPRYLVADYKTNWLGDEAPLTSWHYRPAALTEVMVRSHYPLQAMLYTAALHRFLRWRQPAYDPAVHLGGVLYLFVRGMCGPDTPVIDGQPCGVFAWRPSPDFVVDLSAVLDGRPS
jgi:exodeoxyribonuclease V beta subunit